jgi:tetratricopeptide (TPR) repeat protein
MQDDNRAAIQDYTRAIELNPDDAKSYYNRGVSRAKTENERGALQDYNKAVSVDPNDVPALYARGTCKQKLEDYAGSLADFSRVIDLSPKRAGAFAGRGYAKNKLGDYKGAIVDYTQAIGLSPEEPSRITTAHCKWIPLTTSHSTVGVLPRANSATRSPRSRTWIEPLNSTIPIRPTPRSWCTWGRSIAVP